MRWMVWILFPASLIARELPVYQPSPEELRAAYERAEKLPGQNAGKTRNLSLTANWSPDGQRFWYRRELWEGRKEFVLVQADTGKSTPAFDHARLANALGTAAQRKIEAQQLPFDSFDDLDDLVRFQAFGKKWNYSRKDGTCREFQEPGPKPKEADKKPEAVDEDTDELSEDAPQDRPKGKGRPTRTENRTSPDGNWSVLIRDFNLILKPKDGPEKPLTTDGKAEAYYGQISWAPDSKTLFACRIEPGDRKQSHYIESSAANTFRGELRSHYYPLPGDRFDTFEPMLVDMASGKLTKLATDRIDWGRPEPRWAQDGRSFKYEKMDRGHQRFRIFRVDVSNAKVMTAYEDASPTFVNYYSNVTRHYLDETDELIINSEREGWNHLYLVDLKKGVIRNRITQGELVVRRVLRVDARTRTIEFFANGPRPGQDPYLQHFYRVDFDGKKQQSLTDSPGNHEVKPSPNGQYFVATWSRVDQAPVHELRTADGRKVAEIERADISRLIESGWKAPEVFVAPGRDGKTEIWGMITRPRNFDPKRRYPIIEYIYAGPHGSHVPKRFSPFHYRETLAELGFIVVQCDGMGTCNRSKAFHDVCWKNLADAGFPDRIRWIEALAKKYPYMDHSRVGIYGGSAGGQNSTGALLFHGDFYKVAVSSCGCHDNRMDKSSWNEQWMGYPVGPHYAQNSNITHAAKLKGKLLLIVGELDTNVPPESTYRLCDAFIKARRPFDFLMVPGFGHGDGGNYGERRRRDFFVRHLHGVEPPEIK